MHTTRIVPHPFSVAIERAATRHQIVCPRCWFTAEGASDGEATRILGNHIVKAHFRPRLKGEPAGRTWGDFLAAMHTLGVQLTTPLASIEYGISGRGSGRIDVDVDPVFGIEVTEVSQHEVI